MICCAFAAILEFKGWMTFFAENFCLLNGLVIKVRRFDIMDVLLVVDREFVFKQLHTYWVSTF